MSKMKRLMLSIYSVIPRWIRDPLVWLIAPKHGVGVVAVVFNEKGQVLVLRQTYDEPVRLPGGIMEYGEQPEQTICRELIEEAQCIVEPISILGVTRITRRKFDIFLSCRLIEQRPFVANEEVAGIEWRNPNDPSCLNDLPELHQMYIETASRRIVC
jgi:8-oxo-dGTP pyrophosphatase MutT (NUDIX family)